MSETRTIRVMLVEDHAAFRQSLAALLEREPDLSVVAQAGTIAQARKIIDTPLDVAVLDLALPDGDGRDLIGEVLKAGADAVLHKVASPTTIVEEVRRLAGE